MGAWSNLSMGAIDQGAGDKAQELGRRANRSDALDGAVRLGLVVYGLVHLVVAGLIIRLALGERSGSVSPEGALKEVGEQPLGTQLLVVVAVGMALLVGWRLLDAVTAHGDEDGAQLWGSRAGDLLKAGLYAALAWNAVKLATGGSSGGGTRGMTAELMDLPMGRVLVGAVGLGVIAYGAAQVWKGLNKEHREHLASEGRSGTAGSAYLVLGQLGFIAKGIVAGLVGVLFLYAAITHEARKSGGVDGAIRQVLDQPFGIPLLVAVGVGIGCYGAFALARARHLSR